MTGHDPSRLRSSTDTLPFAHRRACGGIPPFSPAKAAQAEDRVRYEPPRQGTRQGPPRHRATHDREDELAAAEAALAGGGGRVPAVRADLSTAEGVERLWSAVAADDLRPIAVNVTAVVHLAKLALPALVARGSGPGWRCTPPRPVPATARRDDPPVLLAPLGPGVGCWRSPGRPRRSPLPEPTPAAAVVPDKALLDWCQRLPKVELHLHLEGAIPHHALWELVRKYGADGELGGPAGLAERLRYRDFAHFIAVWAWKNDFLRQYEDFTMAAEAVARDLAVQRIRYAEVFFSPGDFARHGLAVQPLAAAIRAGLDRVPDVEVALIADLIRDTGPQVAAATLEAVAEVGALGVVGVGLGGSEQSFPPEPFAAVYERARGFGLRTTVHAGEAAGPASVWGAIRALRPDRIGHGTRAAEDPVLLAHLAATRLPVEACPLSNVATKVVGALEEHPIRRLMDAGVLVTVNTDDPAMFGNSLAQELALLQSRLGFTPDQVRRLLLDGVTACWLPEPRKRQLADAFRADPAWATSPGT